MRLSVLYRPYGEPALRVVLTADPGGRGSALTRAFALVDSGASSSLFSLEVARGLGIDAYLVPEPEGAAVVGSSIRTWTTDVPIHGRVLVRAPLGDQLWGPAFELRPIFSEHDLALLGRWDFFRAFTITFQEDELAPLFHLDHEGGRRAA